MAISAYYMTMPGIAGRRRGVVISHNGRVGWGSAWAVRDVGWAVRAGGAGKGGQGARRGMQLRSYFDRGYA